jgi:hypothetical protein
MKSIILTAALLLPVTVALGQTEEIKKPFIEVSGTSETEVTPDEIYVTITLQERTESKEKLTIEKQEEDLKAGIKELGIDISNLVLNAANADYRKIKAKQKDVVTSKCYNLKVGNADMVDKVYKLLDKINAYDAYISKLTHSKITELTKENRIKAIKAAKDKAGYLAMAVGNYIGSPLQLTETLNSVESDPYGGYYYGRNGYLSSNVSQSYNNYSSGGVSENYTGAGNDEISIRKIKIKSSFLVKYEIKDKP